MNLPRQGTRDLEFGIEVNWKEARVCHVTRLRHQTGALTHEVIGAWVEWVTGSPVMQIRYNLRCGDVRSQVRAVVCCQDIPITCSRCEYRKRVNR